MRISIIGGHRTGKTTLARALGQKLGIDYVPGGCAPVFDAMCLSPTDNLTFTQRLAVQHEILGIYHSKVSERSSFITDRSPLDFIAYLLADLDTERAMALTEEDESVILGYIEQCLHSVSSTLDVVVLVMPGIPVVESNSSAACKQPFIEKISALIYSYALNGDHSAKVILIPRELTDLEQRVDEVVPLLFDDDQAQANDAVLH